MPVPGHMNTAPEWRAKAREHRQGGSNGLTLANLSIAVADGLSGAPTPQLNAILRKSIGTKSRSVLVEAATAVSLLACRRLITTRDVLTLFETIPEHYRDTFLYSFASWFSPPKRLHKALIRRGLASKDWRERTAASHAISSSNYKDLAPLLRRALAAENDDRALPELELNLDLLNAGFRAVQRTDGDWDVVYDQSLERIGSSRVYAVLPEEPVKVLGLASCVRLHRRASETGRGLSWEVHIARARQRRKPPRRNEPNRRS